MPRGRKSKKTEEIKETKSKEEKIMENQVVDVEVVETTAEEVLGEEPETKPAVKEEVLPANPVLGNPFNTQALENLIRERKNLIVKINDVYEISRPLALELLKSAREQIFALNGELHEKFNLLHADKDQVIMECQITVRLKVNGEERSFTVADIGDAYAEEKGKGTVLARVAATRALKRALERLVGEDFINRVIMSLPEVQNNQQQQSKVKDVPASEKQKEWVKKLQEEGKISKDVDVENLTKSQASALLDKVFKKKSNSKAVSSK